MNKALWNWPLAWYHPSSPAWHTPHTSLSCTDTLQLIQQCKTQCFDLQCIHQSLSHFVDQCQSWAIQLQFQVLPHILLYPRTCLSNHGLRKKRTLARISNKSIFLPKGFVALIWSCWPQLVDDTTRIFIPTFQKSFSCNPLMSHGNESSPHFDQRCWYDVSLSSSKNASTLLSCNSRSF